MLMWGGNVSASALSGQKRALDTMELELQDLVSLLM